MKKRIVLILTLAMIVTSLPLFAFGEDGAGAQTTTQGTAAAASTASAPVYKNCVRKEGGKLVYYDASGKIAKFTGWKTIGSAKYWANSSGTIASSPVRIPGKKVITQKVKWKKVKKKGKKKKVWKYKTKQVMVNSNDLYLFGPDGKLINKTGLFTYNGNTYYGLGGGAIKTGWAAIGNKAMYFYPNNGTLAKNTTIGYLKIPANGALGEAYALGVKQLDKSGWNLKAAYTYSYKLKYKGRKFRTSSSENYAIRGFKTGKGNCYVMAATFYIQAKLLGYDVHQVAGRVDLPHSWTVIKENGKEYVYDPNFRNETGRNGYRIWYGKKGTWRYRNYHKMN